MGLDGQFPMLSSEFDCRWDRFCGRVQGSELGPTMSMSSVYSAAAIAEPLDELPRDHIVVRLDNKTSCFAVFGIIRFRSLFSNDLIFRTQLNYRME